MSGRRRILLFLLFMIPVFLLAACRPEVSGGENTAKKPSASDIKNLES